MSASPVPDLEQAGAEEVLAHVVERFAPAVALACSFQKEESVLLDMLARAGAQVRVFALDTHVLFPETYETWGRFERHWGIEIERIEVTGEQGPWTAERCCSAAKVAGVARALEGAEAWITGIRREQAPTRAGAAKLEWDEAHGIWKANPLADWSEQDIWARVMERGLPYNPLHDQGYASIGCAPCTLPGSGREGRWAGQDKTECGIHVVEG